MNTPNGYAEARAVVRAIERRFATVTLVEDGIQWSGPGFSMVGNALWARSRRCRNDVLRRFLLDTNRTPETSKGRLARAYIRALKSTGHLLGMLGNKIVLVRDETIDHAPRQDERANDWWTAIKEWSPEMRDALYVEIQYDLMRKTKPSRQKVSPVAAKAKPALITANAA